VTVRLALGLALVLASAGCGATSSPNWQSVSESPRTRCMNQPQRSQNYSQTTPLFYLFCVESP